MPITIATDNEFARVRNKVMELEDLIYNLPTGSSGPITGEFTGSFSGSFNGCVTSSCAQMTGSFSGSFYGYTGSYTGSHYGSYYNFTTKVTSSAPNTASYTASDGNYLILCSGAVDIRLPAASDYTGRMFVIKNIGSSVVRIMSIDSTDYIDNLLTASIKTTYSSYNIISAESDWWII